MTISTMAGVARGLPGQRIVHYKTLSSVIWHGSFWAAGVNPAPATYPSASTTWVVPTSATPGAHPFVNAGGSAKNYLARFECCSASNASASVSIILYDRLAHTGAITPDATTQTLTTTPLTRPDAAGAGVELWWEWITSSTSTPSNFSCSYTNQSGTAGQTTNLLVAAPTSTIAQMQQFTLPPGDSGVRSVESFTGTGTIGGTGMLVLLRRIGIFPALASAGAVGFNKGASISTDLVALGMPQIYNDACLALIAFSGTGFSPRGFIDIIQG